MIFLCPLPPPTCSCRNGRACALFPVFECRADVDVGAGIAVCQGRMAQLAAERSEAAAAAKRGLEDNVRLEKQLVDARRKVHITRALAALVSVVLCQPRLRHCCGSGRGRSLLFLWVR